MSLPKELIELVDEITRANLDNVTEAKEVANRRVRTMPGFGKLKDLLVTLAIDELVFRARCAINVNIKRDNEYGGPPKVNNAAPCVERVFESVYDTCIGGKSLGSMLGCELIEIAHKETELANGHTMNARLLQKLRPLVADDKAVRDCVPEKKIKAIWRRLQQEVVSERVEVNGHA